MVLVMFLIDVSSYGAERVFRQILICITKWMWYSVNELNATSVAITEQLKNQERIFSTTLLWTLWTHGNLQLPSWLWTYVLCVSSVLYSVSILYILVSTCTYVKRSTASIRGISLGVFHNKLKWNILQYYLIKATYLGTCPHTLVRTFLTWYLQRIPQDGAPVYLVGSVSVVSLTPK